MKKASIIMAVLACAIIAAAYTNSVPISTNTRAATEKWTAIRFEPALPPTPENAASKFLNGNREWQTVAADQIGAATTQQLAATTAALAVHTNRTDNPHGVTAPQIGAITAEQDLAALRAYHYGSPDIVESPAGWFAFDGAGTITAFNWAAGRTNVVIPWAIGGVPVTAIGGYAFDVSGVVSLITPQTVTSIGDSAFITCHSLASVNLPQVTSIGDYAFYDCAWLTSVHMGRNAPAEAADVFADINPPPTVYVTDPQATGWGATWNGVPVVRPPLHGSNVTAQAYTLNGDTITEWPDVETSIIAPLYESGTNVTVTSAQSVYSVAVTGAGPVGIDWSGLSLDGTGRAEVTLRINVTDWAGTNVTFAPSLTFDRTPEILVTGVWEFAASTIDGVTTRIRQTWPECCGWSKLDSDYGVPATVGTMYDFEAAKTNFITLFFMRETKRLIRYTIQVYSVGTTSISVWMTYAQAGNTAFSEADIVSSRFLTPGVGYYTMMDVAETKDVSPRCVKLWIYPQGYATRIYSGTVNYRPLNANERAAYEAGWRP